MVVEPRCVRTCVPFRLVPPFSTGTLQYNTAAAPLPKSPSVKIYNGPSTFQMLHTQGDLPFSRNYCKSRKSNLTWHVPLKDLDFDHYLPIFFDGLSEEKYPFSMLAQYAIYDAIGAGGEKIIPVIPRLILPIRKALHSKNYEILSATLRIIQYLAQSDNCIGLALVPYYHSFLPKLIGYCNINSHTGDRIDYGRSMKLGDLIDQTLQVLECTGGKNAYILIKYMIPTYESCVRN